MQQKMIKKPSSLSSFKTPHTYNLQLLENRVQCINRRHQRLAHQITNNELNSTCLKQCRKKTSNSREMNNCSQDNKRRRVQINMHNPQLNWQKQMSDRPQTQQNFTQFKRKKYFEIKNQHFLIDKVIRRQKQNHLVKNRQHRLRVIRSNQRGRKNIENYWQERHAKQMEEKRKQKRIQQSLSEVKYQKLRMQILEAEQESLNEYEQYLTHQWSIAQKIRLNK